MACRGPTAPRRPLPTAAGSRGQARMAPSNALLPCCNEERAKDRGQELEEVGGPKCEAMSQRNSAEKDWFTGVYFVFSAGTLVQKRFPFLFHYMHIIG